jgi:hypothetical protein
VTVAGGQPGRGLFQGVGEPIEDGLGGLVDVLDGIQREQQLGHDQRQPATDQRLDQVLAGEAAGGRGGCGQEDRRQARLDDQHQAAADQQRHGHSHRDHDRDPQRWVADHRSEQHGDADAKGDAEHQLDGVPHLLASGHLDRDDGPDRGEPCLLVVEHRGGKQPSDRRRPGGLSDQPTVSPEPLQPGLDAVVGRRVPQPMGYASHPVCLLRGEPAVSCVMVDQAEPRLLPVGDDCGEAAGALQRASRRPVGCAVATSSTD